jgi:outer membrane lipoprotein SlyB
MTRNKVIVALLPLAALAGCASEPWYPPGPAPVVSSVPPGPTYRVGTGRVESVSVVSISGGERTGAPSGVGAVAGAVVGAIIGSQFGAGTGRALATIGGAVAGGAAGNTIESREADRRASLDRRASVGDAIQLNLRMDDGGVQSILQDNRQFQVGDRVQITGDGRVFRIG